MLNTKDIYIFVRQQFQQLFCVFFLFFVFAKQTVKCICIINSFYMRMGSDVWPLDGAICLFFHQYCAYMFRRAEKDYNIQKC